PTIKIRSTKEEFLNPPIANRLTRSVEASDRRPGWSRFMNRFLLSNQKNTARPESKSHTDVGSGTGSLLPKASSTMTWEKARVVAPDATALKDRVASVKPAGCKASSSAGESRETSAMSTTPGKNAKSVSASKRLG